MGRGDAHAERALTAAQRQQRLPAALRCPACAALPAPSCSHRQPATLPSSRHAASRHKLGMASAQSASLDASSADGAPPFAAPQPQHELRSEPGSMWLDRVLWGRQQGQQERQPVAVVAAASLVMSAGMRAGLGAACGAGRVQAWHWHDSAAAAGSERRHESAADRSPRPALLAPPHRLPPAADETYSFNADLGAHKYAYPLPKLIVLGALAGGWAGQRAGRRRRKRSCKGGSRQAAAGGGVPADGTARCTRVSSFLCSNEPCSPAQPDCSLTRALLPPSLWPAPPPQQAPTSAWATPSAAWWPASCRPSSGGSSRASSTCCLGPTRVTPLLALPCPALLQARGTACTAACGREASVPPALPGSAATRHTARAACPASSSSLALNCRASPWA